MKVQIVEDDTLKDGEVVIACKEITKTIQNIQKYIIEQEEKMSTFTFYKEGREYYISLRDILFFETEESQVFVHTKKEVYETKERLYQLEAKLPKQFVRVSKSTILNTEQIYSVDKTFTSSTLVQFYQTHKQVYVSRFYYKTLKHVLKEGRTL
ncbi:MAG: LytTR family DNA-binding domain-containing protein [Bacilli bacterium]|nr:LytTR family DNA-binding domain-containing protein [Bacilli bacterium]